MYVNFVTAGQVSAHH